MGILAPLFLASLAALSLPLIFHLVRRTPRGKQEFSSLMFLSPTPPRLTRRSRLDQVLLLLMRLGVLALLGLAFARPFLREAALLTESDLPRRRIAILIDTSASMQRGDLWQQAIKAAERELDELAAYDQVALFAYTDRVQTLVNFPDDADLSHEAMIGAARQQLRSLQPTWTTSNLGLALTTLASELSATGDARQPSADLQIVVISDFQRGTKLDALSAYEWPEKVRVVTRPVTVKQTTNAHAQLLTSHDDADDAELRVRVANAADSAGDQFFIRWASENKTSTDGETAVYVPPGESRVVRLPRPESNLQADRILLRGDDHDFDNTYYVVPPRKQEITLLYAGDDKVDDPEGLRYYLQLATSGDPLRQVTIAEAKDAANVSPDKTQLIVVSRPLTETTAAEYRIYVEQGGTLLVVPAKRDSAITLPLLVDDLEVLPATVPREGDFALLGEIDFTHPLFVPFANPRYNDFTKIHFWQHQPVKLKDAAATRVLARFDNGDPALLERTLGKGRLLMLTSSWSPDDSQLAVSSKFVPLIGSLLDLACGSTRPMQGVLVGEVVSSTGDEAAPTKAFDSPGIHQLGTETIAVNLDPAESDTALLRMEQLDQLGVKPGQSPSRAERLARIRQQRDTELEGRQKVWRWLLVACLVLLIGETLWAARAARPAQVTEAVA
jgi:hypothetical protein